MKIQTISNFAKKHGTLFLRIGILLFTGFASLHIPTGIALANPVPWEPFGFLDVYRMDLSPVNLAFAVSFAIFIEFLAVFLMVKTSYTYPEISAGEMFLSVALINLITVPAAWFVLREILDVAPMSSGMTVLLIELAVVGVEASFYAKVFDLSARKALWLAFVPNLASYIIGIIAFSIFEPRHPPDPFGSW